MSCAAVDRIRDGIPAAASADMKISVTVFDSSGTALDIAEKLLQNNSTRCPVDVAAIRGNLASDALPDGEFDLVLFGHSLNEIAHDKPDRLGIRAELARKAIGRLGYRGMLLIIEPALLSTSRDLIALRNELCAEGYPVHGPCTCDTACGILESSASATCHDESLWKIPRSVQKLADEAGLDRNAIKMTWFAFSKPDCPAGKHESVYRVVSEPMLNKAGRVRYLLCGSKNRMPFSAKKDDQAAAAGGFFLLARGDIVAIENPELRESGLGWRQDTKILRKEKFTS